MPFDLGYDLDLLKPYWVTFFHPTNLKNHKFFSTQVLCQLKKKRLLRDCNVAGGETHRNHRNAI